MWNLLSIVREMYKRNDSNAMPLLEILTEEVLSCEQVSVLPLCRYITKMLKNDGRLSGKMNHDDMEEMSPTLTFA